jgi:hypothetical protein
MGLKQTTTQSTPHQRGPALASASLFVADKYWPTPLPLGRVLWRRALIHARVPGG